MTERIYKGANGDLVLAERAVVIRRGAKGLLHDLTARGEKAIPYSAVTGVQFQRASALPGIGGIGYLRIVVGGDSWSFRRGRRKAWRDENTVIWKRRARNPDFAEAKDAILAHVSGDPAASAGSQTT